MIKVFCFLLSVSAFAVTEEDVKKSVLENFPLVEAAVLKSEAAVGELESLRGGFDHKLSFKSQNRIEDKYDNKYIESSIERMTPYRGTSLIVGHRQGLGNFPAYDGKYATSSAGEIFAGLSVPLLRNSRTDDLRTAVAIGEIEKAQAQEEAKLKKTVYTHKALSLYYKLRLEQRKLLIRRSILELAMGRTEMLEKRYQSGDLERIKLTDNQRTIQKRQDEILKTELEIAKLRADLSLYVSNIDDVAPLNEEPSMLRPSFSFNSDHLPQIKIADAEVKKLKLEENNADQARLPGLAVDVLGARELSGNKPYDPQRLVVGVKFDYPLENRKAQGKTVAFSYKVRAAEKQLSYVSRELRNYFDLSVKAAELSLRRWQRVSEEFTHTLKMVEGERTKWKQGSSDLFVVNLREQDLADAEIRKWTVLYEWKQYHLDSALFSFNLLPRETL